MPKPRSYDDCMAALDRGVRNAALEIVKAIFDAELARLQATLPEPAATTTNVRAVPSSAYAPPARRRRRRSVVDVTPRPVTNEAPSPSVQSPPPPSPAMKHDGTAVTMPVDDVDSAPEVAPAIAAAVPEEPPRPAMAVASAAQASTQPTGIDLEFGTVKWFSDEKGYGFIAGDDGDDVFVHHKAIRSSQFRTLSPGQRVLFEEREGPKGRFATSVRAA